VSALADWSGVAALDTPTRYREMAETELRGVSPTYERLCFAVAEDAEVVALLDTLPRVKRQPNLLLGAARILDAPLVDEAAFRAWVIANWPELSGEMLARRTQTNEPGRLATMLPALAQLPGPLALVEVGASAGLCLFPDRYGYRYETDAGSVVIGGRPEFPCRVTGPAPLPTALPRVTWRAGLDLHPLDVTSAEDVRWLQALVWPEQTERAARLAAAVDLVRADPPRIVTGDLGSDLDALVAETPEDATVVVFHTAVLAYVAAADRAGFADHMRAGINAGRWHWISNEGPGVFSHTEHLQRDRAGFVLSLDLRPLGYAGPHGSWLEWFGR
jgi:hypothetical protein